MVSFEVLGLPAPAGSKSRMPNGAMLEGRSTAQRKRHRSWSTAVAESARIAADACARDDIDVPFDGALCAAVQFRFPMPTSRRKAVRLAGIASKVSAPDLDKIVRSTGDGITAGGLIVDDARICSMWATKVEVVGWTGAIIVIGTDEEAVHHEFCQACINAHRGQRGAVS